MMTYLYITSKEFHNDFIMISIFNFGERVVEDPQKTCQGTQSHPNHPNLILFSVLFPHAAHDQGTCSSNSATGGQKNPSTGYVSRCQVINKNEHNISRLTESRDSTHIFSKAGTLPVPRFEI